jgi:cellobiose phosphorylase
MHILKTNIKKHILSSDELIFELLESGDIFRIRYHHNQINLLRGNLLDGSVSNIYLRRFYKGNYTYKKLLGLHSDSYFEFVGNQAVYQGKAFGIGYQVILSVHGHTWVYDVKLDKKQDDAVYDLFYGQDVGIAPEGSILASEAYTAQYIDHQAFKGHNGYTICSRQNQGETQILQLGSLTKNVAYSIDGTQFFGLSYKKTNEPKALFEPLLPSENYQYEFPYIVLQSEILDLNVERNVVFYGCYVPTYDGVVTKPFDVLSTFEPYHGKILLTTPKKLKPFADNQSVITGFEIESSYWDDNYPDKKHLEVKDHKVLSFFLDDKTHVVSQTKELLVERPHGHMLIHGDLLHVSEKVMAQTNFMYGVFASHVVLGNVNFHKLFGIVRNFLNLDKLSGLRIYLKKDSMYQLLTLPSLYEIGINYVTWLYQLEDDEIKVRVFVTKDDLIQKLEFESKQTYDIIVTMQLLMHPQEYEVNIGYEKIMHGLVIDTAVNGFIHDHYPTLKYKITSNNGVFLTDNEAFDVDLAQFGLIAIKHDSKRSFDVTIEGTFDIFKDTVIDFNKASKTYHQFMTSMNAMQLNHSTQQDKLDVLNTSAFWFTHNALVHYASPHGLEQSNGAAWGTRDICQGPVEFFMSNFRYDIVREILLKVFSRQFIENGDFPQWFMFDKYYKIQAHESHGDIIVWPIRTLAYYLQATKDINILNEKIPFMSMSSNAFVKQDATLIDHIDMTIKCIEDSYIPNTHLPRYGGGDWDDTLQPANHDLTSKMVSAWTVALLIDALRTLSEEIEITSLKNRLLKMTNDMYTDYQAYLIKDGIPAGFIIFNENHIEYLLHPSDENTGLKYRLLALKRPIISQMIDLEKANSYSVIIDEHLKHPDGVRLMDTAVTYKGGLKSYFTRAETASNFGREIGIQYCHAHIRYIEAMAKLGHSDDAFEALYTINPVDINKYVPNALYRQANVYFSSSDAAFKDRYQAKNEFEKVRKGTVDVKAGWRMYSSGPGIYLNQLKANVFGLRLKNQKLLIDPMIPKYLDGMSITIKAFDKTLKFTYHRSNETKLIINGEESSFEATSNQYRSTGLLVDFNLLNKIKNEIKVFYP